MKHMVPQRAEIHAEPPTPQRYGARSEPNLFVLALVVGIHVALFGWLLAQKAAPVLRELRAPLVVDLLASPPDPPPAPEPPKPPPAPPVYTPPPVVSVPSPPPRLVIADRPPPPDPPAVAAPPAPPPPRPAAPVAGGDLSASMLEAVPPRYPIESRRKREQGTVLLSVLLGEDGRVAQISVARTSGHRRLDEAALSAVRRWRWSPTMRDGRPVQVRGVVEIPFVLKG